MPEASSVPPSPEAIVNAAPRPWRLGFWSLIATQFQGAFNDNALKFLVIFLIIGNNLSPDEEELKVLLIGSLFALPFILFSMTGGYFADRYSKRTVTIWTKVFEIAAMIFAIVAFSMHNLTMAIVSVFLASTQGALFGPSKYGLLPELLPEKRLSWGNGIIELGTFLAAIVGTVLGGLLSDVFAGRQYYSGVVFLACSMVGLVTSFGISKVPAADPTKRFRINFLADLWAQCRLIAPDRVLCLAVLGNTYFFFLAGLLQFNIVFYGRDVLHVPATESGFLQASIAIGIGLGSLAAGYLSGGKIEYGLIPLGALGITTFGFLLAVHGLTFLERSGAAGAPGILRRLFHRSDQRAAPASARGAAPWRGPGRREPAFLHRNLCRVGVFYLFKHFLHLGPAANFLLVVGIDAGARLPTFSGCCPIR